MAIWFMKLYERLATAIAFENNVVDYTKRRSIYWKYLVITVWAKCMEVTDFP
jgi:hypothetical protein